LNDQSTVIQQTQCWLKSIIIELDFCPFANREFVKNSIRYAVCNQATLEQQLHCLADEFYFLDQHPESETTLLIFPAGLDDFDTFLNLIDYANDLLEDLGYRSVYQLAHFHPDYCFDGVEENDASNYTNRSPCPILHIIREESLQHAIASHPDPASIPETNIHLARKLGATTLQKMLNKCKTGNP